MDFLHSKGSSVSVMLISPSKRFIIALTSLVSCIPGSKTANIVNPFDPTFIYSAVGTSGQMVVSLKVEVIEPLKNVTNEVVQTADYSGIKRARITPLPPV